MFERLVKSGHKKFLLNICYRMHPEILKISNQLFYGNKIKSGYEYKKENFFIDKEKPLMIINVNGKEEIRGTSY